MGNIKPYYEKTRIENAFLKDFVYTDTLSSLNVTWGTEYATRCYADGTQTKYTIGARRVNTMESFPNFGRFSVGDALLMNNGDKLNVLKIPFYDSDGAVVFHVVIRVTCTGTRSAHTWHGGGLQIPVSVSAGISLDDGENIINNDIPNPDYPPIFFSLAFTMMSYDDYPNDDDWIEFASALGDHNGDQMFTLAMHAQYDYNPYNANVYSYNTQGFVIYYNLAQLADKFGCNIDFYEFSDSLGEVSEIPPEYGGGSFDFSSDTIDIPDMPTVGVSTSGCVNVYEITQDELSGFINELFPPFNGITPSSLTTPTDVVEALTNIADCFFNLVSNVFPLAEMWINKGLIDFVLDCHMIPCAPTQGATENICVSWKKFTQTANRITSDYVDVDCGTLDTQECFGNMADYLSTAQLFLPFIGYVPCEPEFFQNARLGVKYRFNVIDGSFMVYIYTTTDHSKKGQEMTASIVAQYGGTCCVHLPITATNYANIFSGLMQGTMTAVASAGGGNPAGSAQSIAQMLELRPEKAGSNSYNASSSFMSIRKPYILIARPSYYLSKDYADESGVPNYTKMRLGAVSGYTECQAPIVDGFRQLDDEEKEELKNLLEDGIYI